MLEKIPTCQVCGVTLGSPLHQNPCSTQGCPTGQRVESIRTSYPWNQPDRERFFQMLHKFSHKQITITIQEV
jgi:hypothetical protein